MRFLIVVPKFIEYLGDRYEFPLGLAYISAILKQRKYDARCINLNHYSKPEVSLEKVLLQDKIDVLLTGGLSPDYRKIKRIITVAKQVNPKIITIIGGGLITSEPELIYDSIRPSVGVLFEGEETIVELAEAIENNTDFSIIDGIIYFDDKRNRIIKTKPRKPISNLDSLPFPDFEGLDANKYLSLQMTNDNYYMYQKKNRVCSP